MAQVENGVLDHISRVILPVAHYFRDIARGYTDHDLAFIRRVLLEQVITDQDRENYFYSREFIVESEVGQKHPAAYPGAIGVILGPSTLSYDPSGEVNRAVQIERARLGQLTPYELDWEIQLNARNLARRLRIKVATLSAYTPR